MKKNIAIVFIFIALNSFTQENYFKYQYYLSKAKSTSAFLISNKEDTLVDEGQLRKSYYDSAFSCVSYVHTEDLVNSARVDANIGSFKDCEVKILQALKQGYSYRRIKKDESIYKKLPSTSRKFIRKNKSHATSQFKPNKKVRRKIVFLLIRDQLFRGHSNTRKRDSINRVRFNKIIECNKNSYPTVQQVGDNIYDIFVQVVINHFTMCTSNLAYSDSLISSFKKGESNNLNNILWNLDRLCIVNGYNVKFNGSNFVYDNDSIVYCNKNNVFRQSFGTFTKMDVKSYKIYLIPVNNVDECNLTREKFGILPLNENSNFIYDETEFVNLYGEFIYPSKIILLK